jgi:hypothetical protein
VKLNARYVSIGDFDDLYFQVSFVNEHPAANYDPSAPTEPYLLLQRQFEDDDGGVCYLETDVQSWSAKPPRSPPSRRTCRHSRQSARAVLQCPEALK